jgi:hypothetical protein
MTGGIWKQCSLDHRESHSPFSFSMAILNSLTTAINNGKHTNIGSWWSGEDERRRGDASERLRLPPRSPQCNSTTYVVKDSDRRRSLSGRNRARYDLSLTVNPSLPRSCNSCSVDTGSPLRTITQELAYLRAVLFRPARTLMRLRPLCFSGTVPMTEGLGLRASCSTVQ